MILRASLQRFYFLMRSLRFDDINSRNQRLKFNKSAPIREFLTQFVENCQNSYSVGEFVTVDEMYFSFRERCGFIQYMTQKSVIYGLKMYALCNARNCILSIEISTVMSKRMCLA